MGSIPRRGTKIKKIVMVCKKCGTFTPKNEGLDFVICPNCGEVIYVMSNGTLNREDEGQA